MKYSIPILRSVIEDASIFSCAGGSSALSDYTCSSGGAAAEFQVCQNGASAVGSQAPCGSGTSAVNPTKSEITYTCNSNGNVAPDKLADGCSSGTTPTGTTSCANGSNAAALL